MICNKPYKLCRTTNYGLQAWLYQACNSVKDSTGSRFLLSQKERMRVNVCVLDQKLPYTAL